MVYCLICIDVFFTGAEVRRGLLAHGDSTLPAEPLHQFKFGSRGEIGSSANLMEQRSFHQVPLIVLNKSNIRHKRDNCRKQQILLLLLCCLNGSLKESRCWIRMPGLRPRRNVLRGTRNATGVRNIPRKSLLIHSRKCLFPKLVFSLVILNGNSCNGGNFQCYRSHFLHQFTT